MTDFIYRLLCDGFKPRINKDYSPKDNWYGVSLYQPYEQLIKEGKILTLSICEIKQGYKSVVLESNEVIIFSSNKGFLPSKQQMEDFINA